VYKKAKEEFIERRGTDQVYRPATKMEPPLDMYKPKEE